MREREIKLNNCYVLVQFLHQILANSLLNSIIKKSIELF